MIPDNIKTGTDTIIFRLVFSSIVQIVLHIHTLGMYISPLLCNHTQLQYEIEQIYRMILYNGSFWSIIRAYLQTAESIYTEQ